MKKAQAGRHGRQGLLIRGAAVVLAGVLVAGAWGEIRSNRKDAGRVSAASARSAAAAGGATAGQVVRAPQPPAETEWRYDAVIKRNLFMPPGARQQAEPLALPPLEPMPVDVFTRRDLGQADDAEAEADTQLALWTYAGYATVNATPVGIVQNSVGGQAEFLSVGEALEGFVVTEITPESLRFARGREVAALPISQAFTATPLNEPPRPQQAARGQGGQTGGGPGGRGGRGEFLQRMLPALRDNPELAEQARALMQNLMRPGGEGAPAGPGLPPWAGLMLEGGLP